jgi:hypothetical protein
LLGTPQTLFLRADDVFERSGTSADTKLTQPSPGVCPLLREEQTLNIRGLRSAFGPERTSHPLDFAAKALARLRTSGAK